MNVALLVFAVTLLAGVLLSSLAGRSVLSVAVLFLAVGFVLGEGVTGVLTIGPSTAVVEQLARVALFSVLFTDGMRVTGGELRSAMSLPGRALLLGLPLTLVVTGAAGHFVAGLPWGAAFLVGAALSPTDPVFAAALMGREEVPQRLRHLLNVESGLNDGLALPIVLVLIAAVGTDQVHPAALAAELGGGVAVGVVAPWLAVRLERLEPLGSSARYEPLNAFAVGLIVYSTSQLLGANLFLSGFTSGAAVASFAPEVREAFHQFGELVAELLKLLALLVFGALISPHFLAETGLRGYLFVAAALLVARPVALAVALLGSELDRHERVAAAWFGPKGFAPIVYGVLILRSHVPRGNELFHLIAVASAVSIVVHATTAVPVARWFEGESTDLAGGAAG